MWRTVSFLTAQASLTFRGPRLASAVVIENMLFTSTTTTLIRSSGSAAFKNLNDGQ
jgi:hypothetical protein